MLQELKDLSNDPPANCSAGPHTQDDMFTWKVRSTRCPMHGFHPPSLCLLPRSRRALWSTCNSSHTLAILAVSANALTMGGRAGHGHGPTRVTVRGGCFLPERDFPDRLPLQAAEGAVHDEDISLQREQQRCHLP